MERASVLRGRESASVVCVRVTERKKECVQCERVAERERACL